MINPDLLKILCCPETHQGVALADAGLVERLNEEIQSRRLKNRAGATITERIEGGLLRSDGKVLYPIRYNIPVMLIDEAIALA